MVNILIEKGDPQLEEHAVYGVKMGSLLYLTKGMVDSHGDRADNLHSFFLLLNRTNEDDGQCICGLWSDLLYRQLQRQVHYHQLCLRHQDISKMGPQHTVHKPVRVQLHGGLQPQRKSAVRLGQQASSYLLTHF